MALDKRTLIILSSGVIGVACILYIVSNALASWGTQSVNGIETTFGLWRLCTKIIGVEQCFSLDCDEYRSSSCAKYMAARAFVTVACIGSALGTLFLLCRLIPDANTATTYVRRGDTLPFTGFIAGVIGVAVGIAFVKEDTAYSLGVAAIIGIVAVIVNLVGAILTVMIPS